jgi:hypothetical protein
MRCSVCEHLLRRGIRRAGRWYATGLHAKDFNGVFGYQARRTLLGLQHALCALSVWDIKAVATAHDSTSRLRYLHKQAHEAETERACRRAPVSPTLTLCAPRQVFIAISVFLGDGIYNLLKTVFLSVQARAPRRPAARRLPARIPELSISRRQKRVLLLRRALSGGHFVTLPGRIRCSILALLGGLWRRTPGALTAARAPAQSYREQRRRARELPDGLPEPEAGTPAERAAADVLRRSDEIFAQDRLSMGWCAAGYVASCALAIGVVPLLYPPAKWCARARAPAPRRPACHGVQGLSHSACYQGPRR